MMTREKWFFFVGAIFGVLYARLSRKLDWPFLPAMCVCFVFYWTFYYVARGLAALWKRIY